jgi:predicted RNA polymerase sigma factor
MRPAAPRTGPAGELVPLAEQDRSRWDRALIAKGVALVSAALRKGAVGEYQVQAAIAAVHDEAKTADTTDWPQILALYGLLERMTDNPMVTLNRAVAAAMVDGPVAGRDARRHRGGDRALPDGGRTNHQPGRTALPAGTRGTSDAQEPINHAGSLNRSLSQQRSTRAANRRPLWF